MLTYRQIVECVRSRTGRTVRTCWIAEVKRELGLTKRVAWNRGQGRRASPCPEHYKEAIRYCLTSSEDLSRPRDIKPLGQQVLKRRSG